MALIEFTNEGLFCPAGDFYIDPWLPVNKAIITHAHSDHARPGSAHYLCHTDSFPILKLRLGDISAEKVNWNVPIFMNGVKISLHPAGHIIGSSQVRIEYDHETWVVSGDYKTEDDGIFTPFEPKAGPTGGAGFAWPPLTCSFTKPEISFAMFLLFWC